MPHQLSFEKVDKYFNKILKNRKDEDYEDLNIRYFLYLRQIKELGSPTISELASSMDVTKPSASNMIKKLQKMGFVTVKKSTKDKRVSHLHISNTGEEVLEFVDSVDQQFFKKVEGILGDDKFKVFANLWEEISRGLDEEDEL